MDVFILLCIAAINLMSIIGIHRCLKGLNQKQKIGFLAIGFGGIYLLVSFVYFLSTLSFESKEALEYAKQYITFTFVPVNATISLVFLARAYTRFLAKQIDKNKLKKTCIKIAILLIVVFIIEFFYFRSVNQSMLQMAMESKGA